jgi:hypothetical protein
VLGGISVYQAVRICDLMVLYEYARFCLNDGLKVVGFASAVPLLISAAFVAFSVDAVSQPYATQFVQANCVLWGLVGISMILAPRATIASWSLRSPLNAPGVEFSRLFGYYLVASAVLQGAIDSRCYAARSVRCWNYGLLDAPSGWSPCSRRLQEIRQEECSLSMGCSKLSGWDHDPSLT